jgi:hypothetical protein
MIRKAVSLFLTTAMALAALVGLLFTPAASRESSGAPAPVVLADSGVSGGGNTGG